MKLTLWNVICKPVLRLADSCTAHAVMRVTIFVIIMNLWVSARADSSYISSNLGLLTDSYGDPKGLTNRLTGVNWLSNTVSGMFSLNGVTNLKATISYTVLTNTAEILATLTITNPTASAVSVSPSFPLLSGLSPGANLTYCFPQEGDLIHTNRGSCVRYYGDGFPLQFVDYYNSNAGGIYIMTEDQSNFAKTYSVSNSLTTATNNVVYGYQSVPSQGSWVLKCVMGAHTGDWHAALSAYINWVGKWYNPISPRKSWFQNVYNLRVQFVFTNLIFSPPAIDPASQQYVLNSYLLAEDQTAFGGDDFIHLFDWSTFPAYGRVLGDYDDWTNLVSASVFANQITNLSTSGVPVGLYFEGYLVATNSVVGQSDGTSWEVLNSSNTTYNNYGVGYYYMCPDYGPWQTYLSQTCSNVVNIAMPNAVYLDEYGFGYQYPCYNTNHNHEIPDQQLQAESLMMTQVRGLLPTTTAIYTEARGTDVSSQNGDGSYSSSILQTINDSYNNPSYVDLARFALPSFKVFQNLFVGDQPLTNAAEATQGFEAAFFNGEGLYLEGPLNGAWYPGSVGPLITQTHSILRAYEDAFSSTNPTPLVQTLNTSIFANQFPGVNRTVWTLYNASSNTVSGLLLAVTNVGNANYYDAWNTATLVPAITNNIAYLTLSVGPQGLGCVVQQLYYSSNVIASSASGYWRLDETNTAGTTATNLGSLGASGNGTYSAAGVTGGQAGAIADDPDTSCAFNGTAGKVEVPYSTAWNSNTFTVECWAKSSNTIPANYMTAVSSRVNSTYKGYTIYIAPTSTNAGQWQFWTGMGTNWDKLAGPLVTSNQWTHVTGIYDGTNKWFYINGSLVASNQVKYANNTTSSDPFRIGAGGDGTTTNYYFKGLLDEVSVYSYARSAQQIQTDYSAGIITNVESVSMIAPSILVNLTNLTLLEGQMGDLWVQVSGSLPLCYQWLSNSNNLAGQTNYKLIFAQAEPVNNGTYQVIITNTMGSVTSSVATLTVLSNRTGIYYNTVCSNNPVGYWRLDETNTAGTTATNNGTLGASANGTYSPTGVTAGAYGAIIGDSDAAATFDGVAGDVEIPYNAMLNSNIFSVECWANPSAVFSSNYMATLSSRNIGIHGGYSIYDAPGGRWQFWTGTGTNWDVLTGGNAATNTWTHLVGTYDGTNKCFYINGALVASDQVQYTNNTSSTNLFRIGAGYDGSALTNYYFQGTLDEVAVYGYNLSSSQVLADYNAGSYNGQLIVPDFVRIGDPPSTKIVPSTGNIPSIEIQQISGTIVLQWNNGVLQQADQVQGPYVDVTNVTSPLVLSNLSLQGQTFYRVKQ